MDGQRFDGLTRGIGAAWSRRGLLGGITALLAGLGRGFSDTGPAPAGAAGRCLRNGTRCSNRSGGAGDPCRRCCSGSSAKRPGGKGRRCVCRAADAACTTNRQCCSQQCFENVCLDCAEGETACPGVGCVDLQTDLANCGTCGNSCASGDTCEQGVCVAPACGSGGPCTVFVTDQAFTGNLGGLAGADALCQAAADAANSLAPAGTYKAWLSDSGTTSAASRLYQSPAPYVLVDGTQVAAGWAALTNTNTNLDHAIDRSESGLLVDGSVWTNTNDDGTQTSTNSLSVCLDWSSPFGGSRQGYYGLTTRVDGGWTSYGIDVCSQTRRLYCFQQS